MSKLVTKEKVILNKSDIKDFIEFSKNLDRSSHFLYKKGEVNFFATYERNGNQTTSIHAYYGDRSYNINDEVEFLLTANTLKELEDGTKRVKEALEAIGNITKADIIKEHHTEIERGRMMHEMLFTRSLSNNLLGVFEFLGEETLDKHETCTRIWKMKQDDFKALPDAYWRNKTDLIKIYGHWFDITDKAIKDLKTLNDGSI